MSWKKRVFKIVTIEVKWHKLLIKNGNWSRSKMTKVAIKIKILLSNDREIFKRSKVNSQEQTQILSM